MTTDERGRRGRETRKNVLVAMSGGVDSSVAAALLLEEGHEVTGATLKLWGGDSDTGCCSVADVDDARRVARCLGIDHHVFNLGDDFGARVVGPYVDAHARGATPNPCIDCNRHIKFDRLLRRARALGFDALATGHHARVIAAPGGVRRVARGADTAKDQSYVLYMLDQEQLARTLLPVGDLSKAEVRARAGELGLATATKPDSQDVCFVTTAAGREGFLGDRVDLTPGKVEDLAGRRIGTVAAVELVTVGQRRGLGLEGGGPPRFVTEVDVPGATVRVGGRADLLCGQVGIRDVVWAGDPVEGPVAAQTSAHGRTRPGVVDGEVLRWDELQPRVAPGQSVVFYEDDHVLGGAIAA